MGNVIGVFFALSRTRFASLSANFHKRRHELRAACCQSATKRTDISAIAAEFDTSRHVMTFAVFVTHFQASRQAAFAGFSAVKTGIDVGVGVLHSFHTRC